MAEKMYCPRCAREFAGEIGFCRDCGLSLGDVSKIVTGEASSAPEKKFAPNYGLMRIGLGVFILGLVIALGNAALSRVLGFSEVYGTSIFLFTIMLAMALLGAGVIFPRKRYVRGGKDASWEGLAGVAATATARLPQAMDIPIASFRVEDSELMPNKPPSVTENTTRNLK